ncbi:MAG: hypothetical protein ACLQME_07425 [Alphaproteobacteria bacterium]
MERGIDRAGIKLRLLNRSKGPAMRNSRAPTRGRAGDATETPRSGAHQGAKGCCGTTSMLTGAGPPRCSAV